LRGVHESLVVLSKGAAEEELVEVEYFLPDLGQPNSSAVLASRAPAKDMVAEDGNVAEAVFPSTPWAIA